MARSVSNRRRCHRRRRSNPAPSAPAYLTPTLALLTLAALAFSRLPPHPSPPRQLPPRRRGIMVRGVFLGDPPFSLKPIEDWGISSDEGAAWPVANPAVTCADVEESGFASSFVANPFLFIQGDAIYMFFETKNPITWQGDIAAAVSKDSGVP